MKRFFTATTPHATGVGLLILRIASGGFLAVGHGWSKLQSGNAGSFPDPLGIGHAASFYGAVSSEFVCGLLVALGLFTRLACLPAIFTMGVALAIVHRSDPFFMGGGAAKEPAAIYAAMFLCILLCGPGKYSADHALFGKGGSGGGSKKI